MSKRKPQGSDGQDTAFRAVLDDFLRDKGKGRRGESGTYRTNAKRELEAFVDWLEDPAENSDPVMEFEDMDARVLREYIRDSLFSRDLSARTVHKYYDYISAFMGWCQREALVPEHYGIQSTAREPLPDTEAGKRDKQQTWHREERVTIRRHVDRRAHDAIHEEAFGALTEPRDRALVYVLAYTGVRGAEFLALRDDDRRNGATWRDIADDYSTLEVLSKKQQRDTRAIPSQARSGIELWEEILRPNDDWPLFPTFHLPTLYERLSEEVDQGTVDDITGLEEVFDTMRERDIAPPAMTTDGARSIMKRLTDEAGINVGTGDYLELHGGRRGVGRVLAMQHGADDAARQLDNSVSVVEEAYSEVLAEEQAEATAQAFDEHDSD